MRMFPSIVDYKIEGYKPLVRIYGRDEDGKRRIKYVSGFEAYFATLEKDIYNVHDPRILRYENSPPSLYGEKCVKVVCNLPGDVAGKQQGMHYVKDNFPKSFEADVLFGTRVKIDGGISGIIEVPDRSFISKNDIKPSPTGKRIKLRVQYGDIETIGGSIQDAIDGKAQIPALTIYDNYTNEYVLFTTFQLNDNDIESIKAKIHDFWVTSFENLKKNFEVEKDTEKKIIMKKHIAYLEKNIQRILNSIKVKVIVSPDEAASLTAYLDYCCENRADVFAGWNYVAFDSIATINRMKELKLEYGRLSEIGEVYVRKGYDGSEPNIGGVVVMDLMDRYVGLQQAKPPHKKLDYIAKRELGIGKMIADGYALYNTDPIAYLAYNVVDVMLCVELDNCIHIVDFYVEIATLTSSNLDDTARVQYIDNLILQFVHGNYVLPTRAMIDAEKMSGAVVYLPTPGLHRNVLILDFKGMYPSIMKSLNISIETKDPNGDITAANGVKFSSKKIGVIPYILFTLEKKRDEFKALKKQAEIAHDDTAVHEYDLKQTAVKIISNAFYGVMGYKRFRLADRDVGDAVTSTGRMLSLNVKAFVESKGYKVIYGDTDSLFIEVKEVGMTYAGLKALGEKLCDEINVFLPTFVKDKFGVEKCYCKIEADAPYQTLVMLPKKTAKNEEEKMAKKRYAGYKYKDDGTTEFKVKGLEYVKGNTAEVTKYVQGHALKFVLDSTEISDVTTFLKDLHKQFFAYEIPMEQIGKPSSLGKSISEYENDNELVRAVEYSNRYFKKNYRPGYSFLLYYIEDANRINVIALDPGETFPRGYKVDMKKTWEKLVESPSETILASRGLVWEDVIQGLRTIPTEEIDAMFASDEDIKAMGILNAPIVKST